MVDQVHKIVIITKIVWHSGMNLDQKLAEVKRVLSGHFAFYAGLPSTEKYVTVLDARNDLEAEVALEEYGYSDVEYVAHETLWWFPHGHVEIDRIRYEE